MGGSVGYSFLKPITISELEVEGESTGGPSAGLICPPPEKADHWACRLILPLAAAGARASGVRMPLSVGIGLDSKRLGVGIGSRRRALCTTYASAFAALEESKTPGSPPGNRQGPEVPVRACRGGRINTTHGRSHICAHTLCTSTHTHCSTQSSHESTQSHVRAWA